MGKKKNRQTRMSRIELLQEVKRMWVCWIKRLIYRLTDRSAVWGIRSDFLKYSISASNRSLILGLHILLHIYRKRMVLDFKINSTREKGIGTHFDLSTQNHIAHVPYGIWATWPSKNAAARDLERGAIALMDVRPARLGGEGTCSVAALAPWRGVICSVSPPA